jgi:hypothetical protein
MKLTEDDMPPRLMRLADTRSPPRDRFPVDAARVDRAAARCWNPMRRPRLNGMTGRVLYESANGDLWRLVRNPQSGVAMVEHQPNASSGGRTSLTEVGQFLRVGADGPEQQALLKLIGTLVDD